MPRAVAVVAGSGIDLRPLLTRIEQEIPFEKIPGLSATSVPGHSGRFLIGIYEDTPVVIQSGRRHLYEGCPIEAVSATVDALRDFGAEFVVFTNAAGGLLKGQEPGTLMAVDRVLTWPCSAWPEQPSSLSVDALVAGCEFSGSYMWLPGPSYETRAEIRALQTLGAGAVGMSTAPELMRARNLGLRCAVVSCITNSCLTPQVLTHDHVLAIAGQTSSKLVNVLKDSLPALSSA